MKTLNTAGNRRGCGAHPPRHDGPRSKPTPDWPKWLDCLGVCGKRRWSRHAGDRMCELCRLIAASRVDNDAGRDSKVRPWERTGEALR